MLAKPAALRIGRFLKKINSVLCNPCKKQMPNVVNVRHSHYTLRHLQNLKTAKKK
jgi:hypothetical protein